MTSVIPHAGLTYRGALVIVQFTREGESLNVSVRSSLSQSTFRSSIPPGAGCRARAGAAIGRYRPNTGGIGITEEYRNSGALAGNGPGWTGSTVRVDLGDYAWDADFLTTVR